jgi:hypothetical protein
MANKENWTQHVTSGADPQKNFLVVDSKTETSAIEASSARISASCSSTSMYGISGWRVNGGLAVVEGTSFADDSRYNRSRIAYDTGWTRTRPLFPPFSRYPAKTILMTPRRTASCAECGGSLASRIASGIADNTCLYRGQTAVMWQRGTRVCKDTPCQQPVMFN